MSTAAAFWSAFLWFITRVTPLAFLAAVVAVLAFGAARQFWWRRRDRKLLSMLEASGTVRRHQKKNSPGQSIGN